MDVHQQVHHQARTIKVLLVEDSALVCDRIKELLPIEIVELVGQAEDEEEALELIRKLSPDVIVLDLRLRQGDGFDVLRQIKKQRPAPTVVVLTNYANLQYQGICKDLGADFFLDKSHEFHLLSNVLRRIQEHYVEEE